MGFLNAIRDWAGLNEEQQHDAAKLAEHVDPTRVSTRDTKGPSNDGSEDALTSTPELAPFDHSQWHKKLKKILDRLPASQPQWADLAQEALALDLGEEWVERTYREELALMIRKMVSDRIVTADEHRKMDLARSLMGISDAEAVKTFDQIAREAEQFFGKSIDGV